MADYAIGDLQGCFEEFSRLLKRVDFNPSKDHLYLVGDIVARGPDSLACLDYIYRHQDSMSVTLGNHDLHMIACHYLNKPINPKDKLDAIFNSKKLPHYIAYLQTQPLALYLAQHRSFISHAGLNPDWSIKTALKHAQFAKRCYQSANAAHFFKKMYQPHPALWDDDLNDFDKFRYIVNYFTRMRFLTSNNTLELNAKGAINDNKSLTAWFEHPNIKALEKNLIFGHWAALEGVTQLSHVHALDTGCVWGGALTMMDLQTKQKIVEKPAHLPK